MSGHFVKCIEAIASQGQNVQPCSVCFSTHHLVNQCPQAPFQPTINATTQAARPTRDIHPYSRRSSAYSASVELCMLFNSRDDPRCTYHHCRYANLCLKCKAAHPFTECPNAPKPGTPLKLSTVSKTATCPLVMTLNLYTLYSCLNSSNPASLPAIIAKLVCPWHKKEIIK